MRAAAGDRCWVVHVLLLCAEQLLDRHATHPALGLSNAKRSGDIVTLTGPGEKPGHA